jgi:iron(III) transport system permease protein
VRSWPKSYVIALFISLLALLPVGVLFSIAIEANQLFYSGHFTVFLNTIIVATSTASVAVFLGVPIALATTYLTFPFRKFWLVVLLVPLAIPSYIGAFALYAAFGTGGELDNVLPFTPPAISGLAGSVLVMALYTYPFVVLTTRASLSKIDPSQLYASRTLGLGLYESLWRVVIPRISNGIAGGALLAALYAISDFGTPAIMGVNTYTRAIYVEYNALGLGQAASLSLQLILIVGVLLAFESQAKTTRSTPGRLIAIKPSTIQKFFLFLFVSPVILLSIFLPISVFTLWLFREGISNFEFINIINSIFVSLIAAIVAITLALPMAIAALKGRIGKLMERVTYIGFGIPGIVMGTALVYVGLQLPIIYQTFVLLIFAYVLRFLPLGISSVRNSLEGFDDSLTNAARSLGADSSEAFKRVTLPLLSKGIVAGAALVFLETMRELPATLLLGPTGFETLATYLWRVYEAGYFGRAAIPGLLIILASILTLLIMLSAEDFTENSD